MRIGFIGFGEASFHISKGLMDESNIEIHAYDINATDSSIGPLIRKRATQLNIKLVNSMQELIASCSVIISATSAKYAVQIAKECAEHLNKDHLYVDINAASSMSKEEIASILEKKNTKFVDAAVMGSIPQQHHQVPILLSGDGAHQFLLIGEKYNMNLELVNEQPGSASAIKMSRSIFVKGLTMLLVETLSASYKLGIDNHVMNSLSETFESTDFNKLANNLITRSAIHSERRIAEMDEVIDTLSRIQVDSRMSDATRASLEHINQMDLRSYFDYHPPKEYLEVIKALN